MTPRFEVGAEVRVADRAFRGHCRTPRYLRGKRGVVERVVGAFCNPEVVAHGIYDDSEAMLYRVRFAHAEVWNEANARDSIDAEIFEHWLEPVRAR